MTPLKTEYKTKTSVSCTLQVYFYYLNICYIIIIIIIYIAVIYLKIREKYVLYCHEYNVRMQKKVNGPTSSYFYLIMISHLTDILHWNCK